MASNRNVKAALTPTLEDCQKYCICQRYPNDVFCGNARCTFSGHGRVRRPCAFHPSETYLMDLPMCPHCHSNCVEIFVPSIVSIDGQFRREYRKEELMDCKAREIIPFLTYDQQPYVKEQLMLLDIYAKTLDKDQLLIWKETMQKRCFIVRKKLQLLLKQKEPGSDPVITMADLEAMRDDLYEASKCETTWRRSTAALYSAGSPGTPKVPKEALSKVQDIASPEEANRFKRRGTTKSPPKSDLQKRLVAAVNSTKGRTPPDKVVEEEDPQPKKDVYKPPHLRRTEADSWRKPMAAEQPPFDPPLSVQSKFKSPSQSFVRNMDNLQRSLNSPTRNSPSTPQRQMTPNNATTLFYGLPFNREAVEKLNESLQNPQGRMPSSDDKNWRKNDKSDDEESL